MSEPNIRDWILDHPKLAGFAAAIALAVAFSPRVSAMATWICILVAIVFAIAMLFGLSEKKKWRKVTLILSCLCVAVGIVGFGGWLTALKVKEPPSAEEIAKQIAKLRPPEPTHTLLVRYAQDALPIRIASGDTIYVLQLNPNITQWVWEVQNPKKNAISWPEDLHLKKDGPLADLVYVCTVTNEEERALLDVSISFKISFHALEAFPVTIKKNKDGTQSITMQAPGSNHVMVTINHPGEAPTAARDGAIVKQFDHSVSIPSLHAGQSVRIYLANQSALISKFTFPAEASAIVAGDARRTNIRLVMPNTTVIDRLPWFGLGPATYHWKGVPQAP